MPKLKMTDLPTTIKRVIQTSKSIEENVIKKDIKEEDAKSLIELAKRFSNIDFLNDDNFVLSETDVVVVMQPSESKFELLTMLKEDS